MSCSNSDPLKPDRCDTDNECWRCEGGTNPGVLCPNGDSDCMGGGVCDTTPVCDIGICPLACTKGTVSLGFGTDCDPDCCEQPVTTGADECSGAAVHVISVPPLGHPPVTVTITGDSSAATGPDSCAELAPDLGWWEAFYTVTTQRTYTTPGNTCSGSSTTFWTYPRLNPERTISVKTISKFRRSFAPL